MTEKLEEQLRSLNEKVDRILTLLQTNRSERQRSHVQRAKSAPLSPEEIQRHQTTFEKLFKVWESGEELQVEKELDAIDADELRRFADANNLNVTSKTPKQKVLQLVAGRFRERRQLMRSHFGRSTEPKM